MYRRCQDVLYIDKTSCKAGNVLGDARLCDYTISLKQKADIIYQIFDI